MFHDRGWIPYDEGILAQSAERVLAGEMPHRDFDELYTGVLSYLHAGSMHLLGRDLRSMRLVLFGAFLCFVPVMYLLARRFASPLLAGAVTLTGVGWSFPNYFAGLPSWYNLLFAFLGALFLARHVETGRPREMFAAGVCAGISFLFKLVGLYFLFAAGLFVLFREEQLARGGPGARGRSLPMLFLKGIIALAAPLSLLVLLRDRLHGMEVVHFVIPVSAIALVLFSEEARNPKAVGAPRLRRLAGLAAPLVLGAALPVALFFALYLPSGAIPDLLRGVFVLPQRRLVNASMLLPPLSDLIPAIPYALLLAGVPLPLGRTARRALSALLVLSLAILLAVSSQVDIYRVIWLSARSLGVVAVLVGSARLVARPEKPAGLEARQQLFLVLAVTACVTLQQFPFAGPIYFCYVAPFVILAVLAVASSDQARPRMIEGAVLGFYFLFAVLRLNPCDVGSLGREFRPYRVDALLDPKRARLRVPRSDRDLYAGILKLVADKARGKALFAGPDCPEVYFLSGRKNPTRAILEFNSESATHGLPLPAFLEENGIQVVVINRKPAFSVPLEPGIAGAIDATFPRDREFGNFEVRWRD